MRHFYKYSNIDLKLPSKPKDGGLSTAKHKQSFEESINNDVNDSLNIKTNTVNVRREKNNKRRGMQIKDTKLSNKRVLKESVESVESESEVEEMDEDDDDDGSLSEESESDYDLMEQELIGEGKRNKGRGRGKGKGKGKINTTAKKKPKKKPKKRSGGGGGGKGVRGKRGFAKKYHDKFTKDLFSKNW